jgi:hypothetical protein
MTKIVELDKFEEELGMFSKQHIENFRMAIIDSISENMRTLVENSPVDTGLYAQSWKMEVLTDMVLVGNTAPYAPMIEFGTRPFTPPLRPLLEWARRVLKRPIIDNECYRLAIGIQKKISQQGMVPHHILTNTIDKIMEGIRVRMKK